MLITAALGGAWFLSGEALILLVAIAALYQSATKPKDARPDTTAFAMFLLLIASLSALVCVRGTS
jgi:hypothetical protein